jgi:hypothetical protein
VRDWIVKYWLGALFGALTGAMGWAVNRLRKRQKAQEAEQAAIKEGMLALLHDGLFRACSIALTKGRINVDEMDNINYLYKPYATLGGNGTGKRLFERVNQLPIESAEKQ